jgi:ABC-type tungstate transport system substrate-binding protein
LICAGVHYVSAMQDSTDALYTAAALIVRLDPELREIVALSLCVSLTASICAFMIGSPLGNNGHRLGDEQG